MSSILLSRLEKRMMDEIESIKKSIVAAPAPAAPTPVVAPAPPPALLKEIDTMRASISKTAAVASDASGEIASLKNVNAQLAAKIDADSALIAALSAKLEKALVDLETKMTALACKCAAQPAQPAQPAPAARPVPVIMTAPAPAAAAPAQ
jgi:hypothetical protein